MKHLFFACALLLTAFATQAQVTNTFYGSLSATDPTIPGGRLNRTGAAAVCGSSRIFPGITTVTGVHYKTFTITNPSTTTAVCATLTLTPACSQGSADYLFCSVYTTSFDNTNLATNFLTDMGASPTTAAVSMGVTVSPGQKLVLVISGVTAASTCSSYGLTVNAPTALAVQPGRAAALALSAYPNPVRDVLHISSAEKAARYTLYNATGAAVKQISGSEVSVADLPGGVYLLQHDETRAAVRIVKL